MKNLLVYHFLLDHRIGGPHIYVKTLKQSLGDKVESKIITTGKSKISDFHLINLRHFWQPLYLLEVVINSFYIIFYVLKIKNKNIIFHIHGSANIAPIITAKILNIPVLWHIHETTNSLLFFYKFGKIFLSKRNFKIAVVAKKSTVIYKIKDYVFLPATVDKNFWNKDKVNFITNSSEEWRITSNEYYKIVTIANLNPLKGVDILLDALSNISIPFYLKIIGSELDTHLDYSQKIHKQAEKLRLKNLKSKIEFLGWRENIEIRNLLATCDIFILPSRSEACPISLLEAMAMSCKCIATNVGDIENIILNSPNCILVQPNSALELTKAIIKSRTMKGNDFTLLDSDWELEKVVNNTYHTYIELLKK